MPLDIDTDETESATLRSPCPACQEPGIWLDAPDPRLVKLAEKWERESGIALGNAKVLHRNKLEAESCRVAHGYLHHCAGELRDAIGAPRVLDEQAERTKARELIAARTSADS